jgi:hypothetical protein
MLEQNGEKFVRALAQLICAGQVAGRAVNAGGQEMTINCEATRMLFSEFSTIKESVTQLDAPATLATVNRIQTIVLDSPKVDLTTIETLSMEALSRLCDELQSTHMVIIDRRYATAFAVSSSPFGHDVESKFPKASEDIVEAAKCLAFQRPTATVFHLMRVMEIAVQGLFSKILAKGTIDRPWGMLLSDIAAAIALLPTKAERDAWSEVKSLLYHVKQAWRNDVMHPKQTYTQQEAESIFLAVKAFMASLAVLI